VLGQVRSDAGPVASSFVAIPRLQLIGGGKMGEALLAGLIDSGWGQRDELQVVEKLPDRAEELRSRYPQVTVSDWPTEAEGHVLAVKPGDVEAACSAIGSPARVLSIAAGVTLAQLESALPDGSPVVRAMPNTPALVGVGAAAIAPGRAAGQDDLAWAEGILGSVGTVVRLDESLLDAVTGLSGSGPA
jgi:pyrroline-5-carboxylate reductase